MFALPQFKSQNSQAYPIGSSRLHPGPAPKKHASTSTMPPHKIQRIDISSQTEGLRCPSPAPEPVLELEVNAPIDFQHHPESMRLSATPVRKQPTTADSSPPRFFVSKASLNRQLQQLVCADIGTFSQKIVILPCGHNRANLTATAPVPCSQCQRSFAKRSVRVVTFDMRLRELVDKIFSPQPEPPHFSKDEATVFFERVCQKITAHLLPSATNDKDARTEHLIQSATNAAFAMITGTPCKEPMLPTPAPPEPAPDLAREQRKERSRSFIPYSMDIEKKLYSQPLPDTPAADGRLTLIYLIHKHQKHYHTEKQLRFVEHLPNTLAGRKLADDLSEATGRGLRLLTSCDDQGRLTVDWNPNLPAHTDRNRPFPRDGVERLQRALDDIS